MRVYAGLFELKVGATNMRSTFGLENEGTKARYLINLKRVRSQTNAKGGERTTAKNFTVYCHTYAEKTAQFKEIDSNNQKNPPASPAPLLFFFEFWGFFFLLFFCLVFVRFLDFWSLIFGGFCGGQSVGKVVTRFRGWGHGGGSVFISSRDSLFCTS
jgi:hypothetical protein